MRSRVTHCSTKSREKRRGRFTNAIGRAVAKRQRYNGSGEGEVRLGGDGGVGAGGEGGNGGLGW
eukprot:scaffold3639_cov48-Phaeocystis_antarctica.AAC.1